MPYIENPKTKGSGIMCAIPQSTGCPIGCADCFFQSGRSYLEPLSENLPNIPPDHLIHSHIIRVNDGNDSNIDKVKVIETTEKWPHKFYNTSIPDLDFPGPVVLTVNPANMTNTSAHLLEVAPPNLMFVRVRVNTWNVRIVDEVVWHYTARNVPIVLTFMAYYQEPPKYADHYTFRKRNTNPYWVIIQPCWEGIVRRYSARDIVYTCGRTANTHSCARCGNCLREYHATMERLRTGRGRI